ncbi:MAG TPA: hypothetical protein VJK53_02270 [Candidatus Paceibacterota bacterium]
MRPKQRVLIRKRRLGTIEREILAELSAGDLLYGFLLSARSNRRMYKLARQRAAYRERRKLALQRLIDDAFVTIRAERLSLSESEKGFLASLFKKFARPLKKRYGTASGELSFSIFPKNTVCCAIAFAIF